METPLLKMKKGMGILVSFRKLARRSQVNTELHRAQAALLQALLELRAQAALVFPNAQSITIFTNSLGF